MRHRSLVTVFAVVIFLSGCKEMNNESHDESAAEHAGPTMNFHRIGPNLATGGHLTAENSPAVLAAQGVAMVIDLRDQPPEGEKERFVALPSSF